MPIFNNAKIIFHDLKKSYKQNYKLFISIISTFMLVFLIRSVLALLDSIFAIDEYPLQRILFMVSSTCLIIGLEIGFTKIIFKGLDTGRIIIADIFNYFHLLVKYIYGLFIFYGILLLIIIPAFVFLHFQFNGEFLSIVYNSLDDPYYQELIYSYLDLKILFVLALILIVPTAYISLRLLFWSYFVIDKGMNGYEAIKNSFIISKHKTHEMIFYLFLILLFNLIGLLSIIGVCFTIPLTYIFLCKYYRLLLYKTKLDVQ